MNLALSDSVSALLKQLYSAEDLAGYYRVVADILRERCGVSEFAVLLFDRRHERFLEFESRPGFATEPDHDEYPLRVHDGDLGVLSLAESVRDADALAELCDHVAMALYYHKFTDQQGRLIDESLAHVQALKAMGELLGELDQELVLNKTLKFFVDLLDADVGAARLCDAEGPVSEARWGLPGDVLAELVAAVKEGHVQDEGIVQRVQLPGQRIDAFSLGSVLHLPIGLNPPHSAQIFLVSGDELEVGSHQRELMTSCRLIGGIALQKALDHEEAIRQQRMKEQIAVAKEIQEKLLPDALPAVDRVALAGLSRPSLGVGGDYYDVLELENGDLLAIVADVSGKGIQAAIRMSGLQAMLHSLVYQDLGPGSVLGRLNHFLGTGRLRGHFITACCLRLEPDTGRVRLASAGHEPVILHQPGEASRLVEEVGGLPLGLRADQDYEELELRLRDGARLLLYTDGLTDTRSSHGELFGTAPLMSGIAAAGDGQAQACLDAILAQVDAFRGDMPWPDDLTAVTIHYRTEGTH